MAESTRGNLEFRTSNDIRRAHVELMKRSLKDRTNPPTRSEIVDFANRIAHAGRRLEAEADRADAQNTLDYWNASLISMQKEEGVREAQTELASFETLADGTEHNPENPFHKIGLFGNDNRALVSARADEIGAIIALVREYPIVFVTRAAGTGRSALVMYGVVPRIENSPVARRRAFILSSPSPDPLAGLATMVGVPVDSAKELRRNPTKLREWITEACGGGKALVVVDNLEDLFASGVDASMQEAFARAIAGAVADSDVAADSDVVRAVLLVSEEEVSKVFGLVAFKPYAKNFARSSVLPLSAPDIRRLLEALAKDAGLQLEGAVVEDIALALQGDKSAFELARFMLLNLWEISKGRAVRWDEYARLGRPDQALGRIAEQTFVALSANAQESAERIFMALVKPDGERASSSRAAKRKELLAANPDGTHEANLAVEALKAFEDAGLLIESSGPDANSHSVEIVSDRLMFNWERLDSWIRAERSKDERLPRLRGMASLWDKSGRKEGYLLNEEESIREATEYLKNEPTDSVLTEFIKTSDDVLTRRRRVEFQQSQRLLFLTQRLLFLTRSVLIAIAALCLFVSYQWLHSWYMRAHAQPQIGQDLNSLRATMSLVGRYCGGIPPDKYRDFYELYENNRRNEVDQTAVRTLLNDINTYLKFADPNVNLDLSYLNFAQEDNEDDNIVDILKAKFRTYCTLFVGVKLDSGGDITRDFVSSSFTKTVFIKTDFSGSNLVQSHFDDSELFSTRFVGANLSQSEFRDSIFCDVDFSQASLNNVTFRNASMDNKTIETLRSTAWWQAAGWTEEQVEKLTAEQYQGAGTNIDQTRELEQNVGELIKTG